MKRCALSHTRTFALHAQKHTGTRKFLKDLRSLPETSSLTIQGYIVCLDDDARRRREAIAATKNKMSMDHDSIVTFTLCMGCIELLSN